MSMHGFSKLSRQEREAHLIKMGFLSQEDLEVLNSNVLNGDLAVNLIENSIGFIQIPLGVAVNFTIDGRDYIIPMAVEETSIIAGASKMAKWIQNCGSLTTQNIGNFGIGQIQIPRVSNFSFLKKNIEDAKQSLIDMTNNGVAKGIVKRGGGLRDITAREVARGDGFSMAVIHTMVDTCDAMGANIINQICEFLRGPIEELTREKVGMCILSNLVDTKLTQANVIIKNVDPALGEAFEEASLFAQMDPYRAATNNKGVLNGIDPVLIATGNDWRAVEAGIHAYASRSGQYSSITRWHMHEGDLHGVIEAPISVGIVGGMTKLHPAAKVCLKMLNVKNSNELSRILAAIGLVQNMAAINALTTTGITKGHMRLHVTNLALASGATPSELPVLKERLAELLAAKNHVTGSDADKILAEIRGRHE